MLHFNFKTKGKKKTQTAHQTKMYDLLIFYDFSFLQIKHFFCWLVFSLFWGSIKFWNKYASFLDTAKCFKFFFTNKYHYWLNFIFFVLRKAHFANQKRNKILPIHKKLHKIIHKQLMFLNLQKKKMKKYLFFPFFFFFFRLSHFITLDLVKQSFI